MQEAVPTLECQLCQLLSGVCVCVQGSEKSPLVLLGQQSRCHRLPGCADSSWGAVALSQQGQCVCSGCSAWVAHSESLHCQTLVTYLFSDMQVMACTACCTGQWGR